MSKKIILYVLIVICIVFISINYIKPEVMNHAILKKDVTVTTSPIPTIKITNSPTPTPNSNKKINRTIPILYYHAVSDTTYGMEELFIKIKDFESQMKYLKDNNYQAITFDDLDNQQNFKNPILITFDDGYENNYTNAYPILKKYNLKATIFICTNFLEGQSILKASQIKEMCDIIKFESHSLSHPNLTELTDVDLKNELLKSKEIIESITNNKVICFAYPTGYRNQKVIDTVKKYYNYAVTNNSGMFNTNGDKFLINRIYVSRYYDIEKFKSLLK